MSSPLASSPPIPDLDEHALRLRVIADALPAYIAYVDTDLRYALVNRTYEDWFGLHAADILGQKVADVLGDSYPNVSGHLEAALKGEPQLFEFKMGTVGGERWLLVRHIPDSDQAGHIRGVIVHGIDITERKHSEAKLLQNEKLAAVGRLASSIAHEINNPLEAVVNLLYLIEHTAADDPHKAKEYARTAQQELARVSNVATQTLRFFKQQTAPSLTSLGDLVDSVLTLFQGRLSNASITVHRRLDHDTFVLCFEGEIRQVLTNLIGNAIDAMRNGGVLTVRTRKAFDLRTGRTGVRVTVADTGEGMSQATRDRIFEAFFTTKGISGTGLGLWITHGIVEKHEGRLNVCSRQHQPRQGTVFSLFLPSIPY